MQRCSPVLAILLALSSSGFSRDIPEIGELAASDSEALSLYGQALDAHAGRLIVAAPHSINGLVEGKAYLIDVATGTEVAILQASDGEDDDFFARAVAIHDGLALVGAPYNDDAGSQSGSAYLFDSATGTELQKLVAFDGASSQLFGISVDLSATHAVIGAMKDSESGFLAGAAYLYELSTGQLVSKLVSPYPESGGEFGHSVAIHGSRVAVGTVRENSDDGAVYVFDTSTGGFLFELDPSGMKDNGQFGWSVDMDDQHILVGARHDSTTATRAGAAYLYDVATGALLAKMLETRQVPEESNYGASVALSPDRALIGAPGLDSQRVYLTDIPTRNTIGVFAASGGSPLGPSVAMTSGFAMAGSPTDGAAGSFAGRVFLFDPSHQPPGTPGCFGGSCPCANDDPEAGCLNSQGAGALLLAGGTESVSEDDLVLTTRYVSQFNYALTFMGDVAISSPFQNGLRCAGGSLFRFGPPQQAGYSLADGNPYLGVITLGPGIVAQSQADFGTTGAITAGSSWVFQTWYRDPAGLCGASSNLSNSIEVLFQP